MTLTPAIEKKINKALTEINPIFGVMWRRGGLAFSYEFDTAALEITDGKFKVLFNPKYWKRINWTTKLFIICHEYLHVVLGHWLDSPNPKIDFEWNNIAQDIQVNEMLVNEFGFYRTSIHNWKQKCWVDIVFREKANLVKTDGDSEYYYNLIMQCLPKEK